MILFSSEALSDIDRVRTFLEVRNPDAAVRALRAIWMALERVEGFPEIGQPTSDRRIRQILVRFGRRAYVVRYRILQPGGAIFVTRIWHSREARE
jgi:plasmid stabilization system protein ParE